MADKKYIALLRRSVEEWNRWREENPLVLPELAGAGLRGLDLSGVNLAGADLKGADLRGTILSGASLAGSKLAASNLFKAVLEGSDLDSADLRGVRFLDCSRLAAARNWQSAFRDAELDSGAAIPSHPG